MATASAEATRSVATGAHLLASAAANGSLSHPYFSAESLREGEHGGRDFADAVHLLCALHGPHPSIIDAAADRTADDAARAFLIGAGEGFAAERAHLARLAVAVGPVPGTPGAGASEAAVIGQRAAMATLARSERRGCALGAALALLLDWAPIRALLDRAALRGGVSAPPSLLPGTSEISAIAARIGRDPAMERALLFGAEQLLVQQRGLWDLLEARAQARGDR